MLHGWPTINVCTFVTQGISQAAHGQGIGLTLLWVHGAWHRARYPEALPLLFIECMEDFMLCAVCCPSSLFNFLLEGHTSAALWGLHSFTGLR
jgi:hypothetical protein